MRSADLVHEQCGIIILLTAVEKGPASCATIAVREYETIVLGGIPGLDSAVRIIDIY